MDIFKEIQPNYLILIILLQIGLQVANANILRTSIKSIGGRIRLLESFRVTIVSSFVNFFTPVVGGVSTKALYIKRNHNISYSAFLATLYANYLVAFFVSFIFGLVGVLIVEDASLSGAGKLAALFFGVGAMSALLFMVCGHNISRGLKVRRTLKYLPERVASKIRIMYKGWLSIRSNESALFSMCISGFAAITFTTLAYKLCMLSLGIEASWGALMIFAALASVSLLFNITPGNVGIRESIYASAFTLTSISAEQVVAFSILERTLLIMVTGSGWLLFNRKIINKQQDIAR